MSFRACTEYATESFEECTRWGEESRQECTDWAQRCDSWGLFSGLCLFFSTVCMAWRTIVSAVCLLWTTVTTTVCIAWETLSILLTPLTWVLDVIFGIPILGRLLNMLQNLGHALLGLVAGLPDRILSPFGVQPLKKLRLCIIILRDENGVPVATEADLLPEVVRAQTLWRQLANIEIINEGIVIDDTPAPTANLDPTCNGFQWLEDFWLPGQFFEMTISRLFPTGGLSRLTGIGKPIYAFRVRSLDQGTPFAGVTTGCCLWGPQMDYITWIGSPLDCDTLAHEIGHKLGLWSHWPNTANLMHATSCGGLSMILNWWQVSAARGSEHVSYI